LSEFYINGQQVIDRVKELVFEQIQTATSYPLRPVHALILDFLMPKKNGLQVVNELKQLYKNIIVEND